MRSQQRTAVLVLLALVVALLWAYPWLESHRLSGRQGESGSDFLVTSSLDSGPGSLRSALFAALRTERPATVVIRPPRLVVQSSLPPIATSEPIVVRSEQSRSEVDATALRGSPLFDVRARSARFENVAIRGAAASGIRAVGDGQLLLDGVSIAASGVGLSVAGEVLLEVKSSELVGNAVGIELLGTGRAVIVDTQFRDQRDAGVWFVASLGSESGAAELDNVTFEGGRYGLVLGNGRTVVRQSSIHGFAADGILALGGALEVSETRIGDGRGTGIHAAGLDDVTITRNEVFDVRGLGILLQAATNAVVHDNRLFRNSYGIATVTSAPGAVKVTDNLLVAHDLDGVVLFGDSPVLQGNRALRNGSAGIRVLNLSAFGTYTRSVPLLLGNVLRDNGFDEPEYGEYVLEATAEVPRR